jgi:tetratricopeptide (TPR) repeat protein
MTASLLRFSRQSLRLALGLTTIGLTTIGLTTIGLTTIGLTTIGLTTIGLTLSAGSAFAKDPFRTSNAKPIGEKTEQAFNALFKEGNYPKADKLLQEAASKEGDEPLVYALRATLAYSNGDGNTFKSAATTTREKAEQLVKRDPLRGNIYQAVGNFLEGAAIVKDQGLIKGAAGALGKVEAAFKKLDEAEKIDAQDPELNLLKGNIDLMLAVNVKLPLSDPDKAISRLEGAANPRFIADRSLAWGYRDMKQQDKAMTAVDRALSSAGSNPELQYLKAQIFVRQGDNKTALDWFKKALTQKTQLPAPLVAQIEKEQRGAQARADAAKPAEPTQKPAEPAKK